MPYEPISWDSAAAEPGTNVGVPNTDIGQTLADFREAVLLALGNRTDITENGTDYTTVDKWINQGYRHVAGVIDIKELWGSVTFDLEADQPFYRVPESLIWIKKASLIDDTNYFDWGGRELDQIDLDTYRMLAESDEIQIDGANLPPTMYFRQGRVLVVYPTPADAYSLTVDFRVRPDKLVDTTDSPILPEEFHEVIELAAIWRARRGVRQYAEAKEAQNDMLAVLRPLINSDAEEREAMHMVAQPIRRGMELYRRYY